MTQRTHHELRRRSGFTLMELLLAMALVATLSVTLYKCFSILNIAKRSAESAVRPTRAVSAAMELIARDLENTVVPSVTSATTAAPTSFSLSGGFLGGHEGAAGSEADWVEFHTIGNDATPNAGPMSEGVRRIDWGVRNEGTSTVLIRQVTRNLLAPVEVEPEAQVICRDVRAFAIKYFDGYTWYDEWDSTLTPTPLPLLVQVDLTVAITDPRPNSSSQGNLYHVTRYVSLATAKLPADTTQQ